MAGWIRLAVPAVFVASIASPAVAIQYLSLDDAKALAFPLATDFIPIDDLVWKVQAGGKDAGRYVVDHVIGKHLYIDYAVSLAADGRIRRVDILKYRESYGGEVGDRSWLDQFVGKNASSPLRVGADIRNIAGATLSSHHLTEGIKRIVSSHAR